MSRDTTARGRTVLATNLRVWWIVANVTCLFPHQAFWTFLRMTYAVIVTVDVLLWIRLFIVEAMSVRVLFEAGSPCITTVHQTYKHHEDSFINFSVHLTRFNKTSTKRITYGRQTDKEDFSISSVHILL